MIVKVFNYNAPNFLKKGCVVVIIVQIRCMKNRLREVNFYFTWFQWVRIIDQ